MVGMGLNGKSRLVLIVEDEGLLRSDIADEFRIAGWQVIEADTAERCDRVFAGWPSHRRHLHRYSTRGISQLVGCRRAKSRSSKGRWVIYSSGNAADRSRQVNGSLFFDKPYAAEAVIDSSLRLT
jgi:hypothetical protein